MIRESSSSRTISSASTARRALRSAHWSRPCSLPSIMSGFMSSAYPAELWLIEYITTDG
ncbi:MAG: hypothetical protein O3A46_05605 [Candidatus Poribacteria bacterium]|nr:hypothetical protein [Candidatus Poribacteria bacterium]